MKWQTRLTIASRLWLSSLTAALVVVFFLVSAGRFHFEVAGFAFSSGFNAYKIFPLLFLFWAGWRWCNPTKHYCSSPITLPFSAFILVCVFSSLTSIHPYQSFTETLELLIYFVFYLMLIDLPWNANRVRWVGRGFVAGTWYLIGTCILQLYAANELIWHVKLNGTYDYPNALGVFCILCITLLGWLYFQCQSNGEKRILIVTMAAVILCGLMTQSRAVYLSLVISLFVWMILSDKKLWLAAGTTFVAILLFAFAVLLPKIIGIQSELHTQNEMSRLMIWLYLFEHFLPELPMFGYGLGPVIPDRMADWLASTRYTPALSKAWHPHNLYVYILLAAGVPGLLLFVWWMGSVVQTFWQTQKMTQCILLSGFTGFLVHQCFEVHLLLGNIPVVLIAMMAAGTVMQQFNKEDA